MPGAPERERCSASRRSRHERAYALLAQAYARVPNRAAATKAAAQARQLDATNPRLHTLKL